MKHLLIGAFLSFALLPAILNAPHPHAFTGLNSSHRVSLVQFRRVRFFDYEPRWFCYIFPRLCPENGL